MLEILKLNNPDLKLFEATSPEFKQYGRIVNDYDFSPWFEIMDNRAIPDDGNIYIAEDPELTESPVAKDLCSFMYGEMPLQVGYCNGNSNKLNALEYHKSSEINVAITDLVLLLADIRDIKNNKLSVDTIKGFYLPKGTACEIYATTLHFAPCKVSDAGYKCIVVLPLGTNLPLELSKCDEKSTNGEKCLLLMRNKWLLAHEESAQASTGAYVGIIGINIELKY